MSKITVIGSFVADMVVTVGTFPKEGETVIGKTFDIYLGGKGANQCVAIKRLNGDVEMIGCVGDDSNGKMFKEIFEKEQIKCDKIRVISHCVTGCAQIQIDNNAQNKIIVIPGANLKYGVNDILAEEQTIKNTEMVIFQLEMDLKTTYEGIKLAKKYGKTVILNPAPAVKLDSEILAMVDYLTPNEVELGILASEDTSTPQGIQRAVDTLLKSGVKNIVATLGGQGALIANQDGTRVVKGYNVDVVDTVGAGDSFNGALAVKLIEGSSLEDAVKFANAMGALTVTVKGAIPSLHNREEVENFIIENK